MGTHLPLPKRGQQPPPTFRPMYCGKTAGWIKMPLGKEEGLGPGHIVLDRDPAPPKGAQSPIFGPCLLWPNGRPSPQLLLSTCIPCNVKNGYCKLFPKFPLDVLNHCRDMAEFHRSWNASGVVGHDVFMCTKCSSSVTQTLLHLPHGNKKNKTKRVMKKN